MLIRGAKKKFWMPGTASLYAVRSPPLVSFISNSTPSTASNPTYTTASSNIGTASATRRVIVAVSGGFPSPGRAITGFNINGVDQTDPTAVITNIPGASSTNGAFFVSAVVPTGTTGVSVSVTFTTTQFGSVGFAIYTVDNSLLTSSTPTTGFNDPGSSRTTGSVTVSATAGGFIITSMESVAGTTGNNISASTETFTLDAAASNGANSYAHANGIATNASSSVTWSWTGSSVAGLCAGAWR